MFNLGMGFMDMMPGMPHKKKVTLRNREHRNWSSPGFKVAKIISQTSKWFVLENSKSF